MAELRLVYSADAPVDPRVFALQKIHHALAVLPENDERYGDLFAFLAAAAAEALEE